VLAGALAVGYGVEQRILAFNIGAATPLIIMSLARGLRPRAPDPSARAPARPGSSPDGAAPIRRRWWSGLATWRPPRG